MILELDGYKLNKLKKIHAYMKLENIDFSETYKFYNMGNEEFDELVKSKYEIKGQVNSMEIMKAKKVDSVPTEYEEQRKLVAWLRQNKIPCQSSGNGFSLDTKDNIKYMAKLKATGLSVGYPDLDIFIGNGISLHIEMKRTVGGKVSEMQEKWVNWFNNNGYKAKVCYGFQDAKIYIIEECKKINKFLN